MKQKANKVSEAVKELIIALMDRVLENVLIKDSFIAEKHHAQKPLYAALVPDEIFKGSHFERRFVTPFGSVWEKLAQSAACVSLLIRPLKSVAPSHPFRDETCEMGHGAGGAGNSDQLSVVSGQ